MIEAAVPVAVAIIGAGVALTNRLYGRITEMDRRLDTFELRVATSYVPKDEFTAAIQKIEDHMIRIETKSDKIVMKNG